MMTLDGLDLEIKDDDIIGHYEQFISVRKDKLGWTTRKVDEVYPKPGLDTKSNFDCYAYGHLDDVVRGIEWEVGKKIFTD